MRTLDKGRPYGTVYPPHKGIAFEQDNLYFGVDGKQVHGNVVPEQVKAAPTQPDPKPKAKAGAKAPAKPAPVADPVAAALVEPDSQLAAQLEAE